MAPIDPLRPIALPEVYAARARTAPVALRTPLVRLDVEDTPPEIWLKLENLQPVGSFKIRGAANAIESAGQAQLGAGVWTASAGNMARALAWCARRRGIRCSVVVPDTTARARLDALRRLGAAIVPVPFDLYQDIQRRHSHEGMDGLLIHPFADPAVMAGNGVIGLEILDDLPDVDAVVVPYGGGGLSCGIAAALRALRPGVRVYAAEVGTGAPLAASLAAGEPVQVDYRHSFVTGMGAPYVFPRMWPLASRLLDASLVVSPDQVAAAIRLMVLRNHVVAEGAGAVAVAAARAGLAGSGQVACIVSGGNLEAASLVEILRGRTPSQ